MKQVMRILIVFALVLVGILLARNNSVWAGAADDNASIAAQQQVDASLQQKKGDNHGEDKHGRRCHSGHGHDHDCGRDDDHGHDHDHDHGTVKPPPHKIKVCKKGDYSVGGMATLDVDNMKKGYCIESESKDKSEMTGHLPNNAGTVMTDLVFNQVYYNDRSQKKLSSSNQAQICFADPPGKKQVKIYYLDTSGNPNGTWKAIKTKISKGLACADTGVSGAYVLVGK